MKSSKKVSSRVATRQNFAAERPITKAAKIKERRRLMKVLNTRVMRKEHGAEVLRKEFRKLPNLEAEVEFLRTHVHVAPTAGRQPKPGNEGFAISEGTSQVKDTDSRELRMRVFVKVFGTHSLAARRTTALYGYLRLIGADLQAPLPQLLQLKQVGKDTEFYFEHAGGDCAHKRYLTADQYQAVRQKSIDELATLGVDRRAISHHRANWALTKKGSGQYRALLIDVGRAVLVQGAQRKISARLKSIERFRDNN